MNRKVGTQLAFDTVLADNTSPVQLARLCPIDVGRRYSRMHEVPSDLRPYEQYLELSDADDLASTERR